MIDKRYANTTFCAVKIQQTERRVNRGKQIINWWSKKEEQKENGVGRGGEKEMETERIRVEKIHFGRAFSMLYSKLSLWM